MSTRHGLFLALVFCLPSPIFAQQIGVRAEPDAAGGSPAPASQVRPLTSHPPVAANEPEGLIHLDVAVTDRAGKPVSGMDRRDFTLFDNGQSEQIVSFLAFGGINARPNPPTAVILLIDTRDVPRAASDVHQAVEKFLRQNGGRLAEPVTIYSFEGTDTGFWREAGPSLDGNALAEAVVRGDKVALLRPPSVMFQLGELPAKLKGNLLNQPYSRQPRTAALMGIHFDGGKAESGQKAATLGRPRRHRKRSVSRTYRSGRPARYLRQDLLVLYAAARGSRDSLHVFSGR